MKEPEKAASAAFFRFSDAFVRGQTLCLIETAKFTNKVEAEHDALVRRVLRGTAANAQAASRAEACVRLASLAP